MLGCRLMLHSMHSTLTYHTHTHISTTSSEHITVGSRGYKVSHVLDIWLFKMQNDFLLLCLVHVCWFFFSTSLCFTFNVHFPSLLFACSFLKNYRRELQIQQMCQPFCINLLKHISIFFFVMCECILTLKISIFDDYFFFTNSAKFHGKNICIEFQECFHIRHTGILQMQCKSIDKWKKWVSIIRIEWFFFCILSGDFFCCFNNVPSRYYRPKPFVTVIIDTP